jgi:hypothetical protein
MIAVFPSLDGLKVDFLDFIGVPKVCFLVGEEILKVAKKIHIALNVALHCRYEQVGGTQMSQETSFLSALVIRRAPETKVDTLCGIFYGGRAAQLLLEVEE